MQRMFFVTSLVAVVIAVAAALAGSAGGASQATWQQAADAGWQCDPEVLIFGYYHCAPPGGPSVTDLIAGTNEPIIVLRVFSPDAERTERTLVGIERLIRADLYAGQPCRQDNLATWDLLDFPTDYYACHNFDT